MQFSLLKNLSPQRALNQYRQGKLTAFEYALYRYLRDETSKTVYEAEEIIALRHRFKLTQEALGEILQVSQKTILRWENSQDVIPGNAQIALNALSKLGEGFFTLMAADKNGECLQFQNSRLSVNEEEKEERQLTREIPPLPFEASHVIELREQFHMSRKEFAQLLDVSLSTINKWETGAVIPKGTALALLRILWRDGLNALVL